MNVFFDYINSYCNIDYHTRIYIKKEEDSYL